MRSETADAPRNARWTLSYTSFVLLFALANVLLFQWPLYRYAMANGDPGTLPGILNLLVLTGLQMVLMILAVTTLSLVSLRLAKAFCMLVLVGNALALYFMNTYNVIIDKAMMGNVFNTDTREAGELFSLQLIGYVLLLGILPTVLVARTQIRGSTRPRRLLLWVITAALGGGMIYASSTTWLWFDKHAKHLGGLMLPWSYVANSIRHFQEAAYANQPQTLLPPIHFEEGATPPRKTIVVLVIGESARSKNFSLYGYPRATNPELAKLGVVTLANAVSCSTYTTASLRCMLSHLGAEAPSRVTEQPLPNYLQSNGVEVIWRSDNWGEPPLKVALHQRVDDIRKACTGPDCAQLQHDGAMLYGLKDMLQSSASSRIFVVLHQSGSHGPQYASKYPPAFERFTPVCRSVDLSTCSPESLVNAYDNTILYTDHVLAETIRMLQSIPDAASTMIYMSDHGESLGERGFYLHGAPNTIAPDEQRHVPFLVWTSPAFNTTKADALKLAAAHPGYTQDEIFHSVMGAFGARNAVYKPDYDLFNPARNNAPR